MHKVTEADLFNPALAASKTLVDALLRPEAFPHRVDALELLETHISWIILTGPYAYKIKKPLDLGFLDFSTLAKRQYFCEEELRLNVRFAPQIYLDVVSIGGSAESPGIGLEPCLEYAVRMRQFRSGAELDRQVEQRLVSASDMVMLGQSLAGFHGQCPVAMPNGAYGALASIAEPALDNFSVLENFCHGAEIERQLADIKSWTRAKLDELEVTFRRRLQEKRVRECHGDLHLANLVRFEQKIVAFDCLEFDADLRWIDVMSDVGFLMMDTLFEQRSDLGYAFRQSFQPRCRNLEFQEQRFHA